MQSILHVSCVVVVLLRICPTTALAEDLSSADVRNALDRAANYFATEVAYQGGYVYYYSPDLSRRLGEGVASGTQIWVQPPGTPTVGLAFLKAWETTGDRRHLQAATAAANSLIYGQLKSGAWTNSVDFNPQGATGDYRNGKGKGRNFSTLDDGTSQGAIQLLCRVDQALEFNNATIHESAQTALDALLAAQFHNGAFPQGWDETPVAVNQPVVKASFPDYDWRTEGRIKEYWDLYTLNDGAAGTITQTLLVAYEVYGADRYLTALKKLGEFLILSQMPQRQPAWAQQYSFNMHPVWARKFEPPAIAGRESQDVIEALMAIYRATGDKKYLAPIPSALKYLSDSALPDGRLSRYYELQTNRPLYMQRNGKVYSLTYDDHKLPDHYGWKVTNRTADLLRQYNDIQSTTDQPAIVPDPTKVVAIINSLDDKGRWVSTFDGERLIGQPKFRNGEQYIASEVFSKNIQTLCAWLLTKNP